MSKLDEIKTQLELLKKDVETAKAQFDKACDAYKAYQSEALGIAQGTTATVEALIATIEKVIDLKNLGAPSA